MADLIVDEVMLREPNLLLPGKKPVGSVKIDWDHPISKNLLSCWNMTEGAGTVIRDIAGRENGSLTNVTWDITDKGRALSFGGTGYVDVGTPPTEPFTVEAIVRADTAANAIWCTADSGTTNNSYR